MHESEIANSLLADSTAPTDSGSDPLPTRGSALRGSRIFQESWRVKSPIRFNRPAVMVLPNSAAKAL